jgi:hypothetical protein
MSAGPVGRRECRRSDGPRCERKAPIRSPEVEMDALHALDEVLTQLAGTLHGSSPLPDWRHVTLFAKYAPDGSSAGHDYDYRLADGSVDQGVSPDSAARQAIRQLTRQHWQLTQDLGRPRWFKLVLRVERDGRFGAEFEYRDLVQDSDLLARG